MSKQLTERITVTESARIILSTTATWHYFGTRHLPLRARVVTPQAKLRYAWHHPAACPVGAAVSKPSHSLFSPVRIGCWRIGLLQQFVAESAAGRQSRDPTDVPRLEHFSRDAI